MKERIGYFRILFVLCVLLTMLVGATINAVAVDEDKEGWLWPVEGFTNITPGREYSEDHRGIDICGNGNESIEWKPVCASKSGVVEEIYNGCSHEHAGMNHSCGKGWGNYVRIRHEDGTRTNYAHLKQNSIKVYVGQTVQQGTELGNVGSSGASTGYHLHFEIWSNASSDSRINNNKDQIDYQYVLLPIIRSITARTDGVNLTWSTIPNAKGYYVYRSETEDDTSSYTYLGPTTATSYLDKSELEIQTTYYYRVAAYFDTSCSDFSAAKSVTIPRLPVPSIQSIKSSADGIKVTWAPAKNADGYYIFRSTSDSVSWDNYLGPTTENSYLDAKGIVPGQTYYYWVAAFADSECTNFSSYASINLPQLAAPSGLSASADGAGVNLKWNAVQDVKGYYVYRSTSTDTATRVYLGSCSTNSYVDSTTLPNTTYFYQIASFCSYACSNFSTYCSATMPKDPIPEQPIVSMQERNVIRGDAVSFSWECCKDAAKYEYFVVSNPNGQTSEIFISDTTEATFANVGVLPAGSYSCYVYALSSGGKRSEASQSVSFTVTEPYHIETEINEEMNTLMVTVINNTASTKNPYLIYAFYNKEGKMLACIMEIVTIESESSAVFLKSIPSNTEKLKICMLDNKLQPKTEAVQILLK